jgi:protease YdgD
VTQSGYPEDHLDNLYSHQDCIVTGWAQNSVLSHQCDTLPGDSGSPLLLKTEDGWQVIAVQSSLPAAGSLAGGQPRHFGDRLSR